MRKCVCHISLLVIILTLCLNCKITLIYPQVNNNSSFYQYALFKLHSEKLNVDIISSSSITEIFSNRLISESTTISLKRYSYLSNGRGKDGGFIKYETRPNKINPDDFTYAGSKRYTINGKLPNNITSLDPLNTAIVGGVGLFIGVALYVNQQNAYWEGKDRSFYIKDDWNTALQADKFGHFLGGYYISYFVREALVYSGVGWHQSIILGSLTGFAVQTFVEVKDGFTSHTGFSPSDLAADALGASYFYIQHYVPFLQNFTPKWQYSPPGMIGVPPKARTHLFLDNYNSTTAWISVHVNNLLPESYKPYWPKWLNIAVGYGINGYYTSDMTRRFVIGLDYNLVELLPDGPAFWNWLKQTFNFFKLPAPAIEFSAQGTKFKLLYPFSLSLGGIQL